MGIERFLLAVESEGVDLGEMAGPDVYILVLDEEARTYAQKVATYLRVHQIATEMNMEKRSLKSQFKTVDRMKAPIVVLLGSSEMEANQVTIKNTIDQNQKTVDINETIQTILKMQEDNEERGED